MILYKTICLLVHKKELYVICKVDVLAMKEEDNATLETLHERISAKIYGQEEAVCQVVEAVQMAKAGLLDENTAEPFFRQRMCRHRPNIRLKALDEPLRFLNLRREIFHQLIF